MCATASSIRSPSAFRGTPIVPSGGCSATGIAPRDSDSSCPGQCRIEPLRRQENPETTGTAETQRAQRNATRLVRKGPRLSFVFLRVLRGLRGFSFLCVLCVLCGKRGYD